jgi:hypothetical protein
MGDAGDVFDEMRRYARAGWGGKRVSVLGGSGEDGARPGGYFAAKRRRLGGFWRVSD